MGIPCSKLSKTGDERDIDELRHSLADLLATMPPHDMVIMAVRDLEVFDLCKDYQNLRRTFMRGAFLKYSIEKYFYANVRNRTANYVIILDTLIDIEKKEIQKQQKKRSRKQMPFPLCCFTKKCDLVEELDSLEGIILDIIDHAKDFIED